MHCTSISNLQYRCWHIYCIKQTSSWKFNNSSASQEIHRILRNQKFHDRLHKFPPLVPKRIPSTFSDPISLRSSLMLPSDPYPDFLHSTFLSGPQADISLCISNTCHVCCPTLSYHSPLFNHTNISYLVKSTKYDQTETLCFWMMSNIWSPIRHIGKGWNLQFY